jgi:hypothetical protein
MLKYPRLVRPGLGLLAILSAALTLLALEGGARVYGWLTDQGRGMTFDAELGWRPRPQVSKIGGVWGVKRPARTNARGWRDSDHSVARVPGIRRAVAVGDSFTFGTDVDDGERFTDLLPERIERLEVLNFGVPGYGTDQELRVLETGALAYQPDVVILQICVFNDLRDINHRWLYSWPKPYYEVQDGELHLTRPPFTWSIRVREASYLVETLYQRIMNAQNIGVLVNPSRDVDTLPLFEALMRRMASLTLDQGIRLVAILAYSPDTLDAKGPARGQRLQEVLAGLEVPTLDTRALFAAHSSNPGRYYSPISNHWNAEGHQLVAEGSQRLLDDIGID